MYITGSTFLNNSGTYGGGLYLAANLSSHVRLLSSNFTANNATDTSGLGALFLEPVFCMSGSTEVVSPSA